MNSALDVHPKVVGGSLSGSAGILVIWLLGLAHVTVDPVVAGALVAIASGLGAWLAPVLNAERNRVVQTYSTSSSGLAAAANPTFYVTQSAPKPRRKPASKPKPKA